MLFAIPCGMSQCGNCLRRSRSAARGLCWSIVCVLGRWSSGWCFWNLRLQVHPLTIKHYQADPVVDVPQGPAR
jgi:hypothetical protein